jgi:hypothetical protein
MKREYETTQNKIDLALGQGKALLKDLPGLLQQMKQVATDLRVVEYDQHRGDGVSEREYKDIQKRFGKLINALVKTSAEGRCRVLQTAFSEIEHSSYLIEDELLEARGRASYGKVANRYAQAIEVAIRQGAAPNLRDILKELDALDALDDNINEVVETFQSNFKAAAAIDSNVSSQLDARKKATEGLRKARQVAEAIKGILVHFPEDKTALRAAKDAAVMIKRFERSMDQTAKMIRTLSKKQMPKSLAVAANSAARILRKFLVNPKALRIIPWQGMDSNWRTKVKGVMFNAVLRTTTADGDVDVVLSQSTVDDKGLQMFRPGYGGTENYDKNKLKEYFLEGMAGKPELKGEGDRNSERLKIAPEILDDMNEFASRNGDHGRDRAEMSKDGRVLEVSFRTEFDEADYGQYEEPDFPNYAKKYNDQLTVREKGFIKSLSGSYGEKGWYYITVTLK